MNSRLVRIPADDVQIEGLLELLTQRLLVATRWVRMHTPPPRALPT